MVRPLTNYIGHFSIHWLIDIMSHVMWHFNTNENFFLVGGCLVCALVYDFIDSDVLS